MPVLTPFQCIPTTHAQFSAHHVIAPVFSEPNIDLLSITSTSDPHVSNKPSENKHHRPARSSIVSSQPNQGPTPLANPTEESPGETQHQHAQLQINTSQESASTHLSLLQLATEKMIKNSGGCSCGFEINGKFAETQKLQDFLRQLV